MSFKFFFIPLAGFLLVGCTQPIIPPDPPSAFHDPIIPDPSVKSTAVIRENAVLERPFARGGASIRMMEDADVLANEHYVGADSSITPTQISSGKETKKWGAAVQNKPRRKSPSLVKAIKETGNQSAPTPKEKDHSVYRK